MEGRSEGVMEWWREGVKEGIKEINNISPLSPHTSHTPHTPPAPQIFHLPNKCPKLILLKGYRS
ncbi:MAG: hypothetical protein QNJ63_06665 [Calothrix sp. MO_192.B10]|nr:hypothetical protein [Calothrix sp. MO_192.B10]